MLQILGLYTESYIDTSVSGHNCDFKYEDVTKEMIILNAIDIETKDKYIIELYETEGECSSGWTTASWGHCDITKVEKFAVSDVKEPIKDLFVDIDPNEAEKDYETSNEVFSVSYDGGDAWYPGGYISVNTKLFKL